MSNDITVKINLDGAEEFKRELKTIRAELQEIVELRNRALRPRWLTQVKDFLLGRTMTVFDSSGCPQVKARMASGLRCWLNGWKPNPPHK